MLNALRQRIWRIIFLSDTPAGKAFDVALLWLIGLSVLAVMAETVDSVRARHGSFLFVFEIGVTLLFTIEYFVRIAVSKRPLSYIFSFFGIVDLLSILPTYFEILFPELGLHHLVVIRVLRLLRMFRVLKMLRHAGEARILLNALQASRPKITVFLFGILTLVLIMGTLLYLVEGSVNPKFSDIPTATYWAIVTITTVGYGDITPVTPVGKLLSACMMIIGYGVIAVPTGIVGAEIARGMGQEIARGMVVGARECSECSSHGHLVSARFCRDCGARLPENPTALVRPDDA